MEFIDFPGYFSDAALLLIRLVVGFAFLIAARNKFRNIRKFAKNNSLPVPAGYAVAAIELLASISLIGGIYPSVAGGILVLLMLGTIRLHVFKWKSPYWAAEGGWEYDLMLLAMSLVVFVFGGGALALVS